MRWVKKLLLKFVVSYVLDYCKDYKGGKEMLLKIKEFLAGKKTILISIGAIIGVLIAYSSGSMEIVEAVKAIIEALLAMTIRAAIAK